MSKRVKREETIRNNPQSVSFEDLCWLLESYGFHEQSRSGSHATYVLRIGPMTWRITVPYKRPHVKRIYVMKALAIIDERENGAGDGL